MEIIPEKKKNNAVVFGLSSKLVFAVASVMIDLKKYSPGFVDEVIILHDGNLQEKDKNLLSRILPARFIKYDFPFMDRLDKFDEISLRAYTYMVHSIYECFNFLNEFHNVIWLDFDILITGDISDITSVSPFSLCFGGTSRISLELYRHAVEGYDMTKRSMNTGVVVFKDDMGDYNSMYEFCYNILDQQKGNLALPDQAVMYLVYQHFDINYGLLPEKYVIDAQETVDDTLTRIVHAAGSLKFWNSKEKANAQWTANYRKWVKMGGTRSRDMMIYKKMKKTIKDWMKNHFMRK